MGKLVIKQDVEKEVPVEILAQSIADIGTAMKRLSGSRLKKEALVVLVSDATGISKRQVTFVLNALDDLENLYLKPKKRL